MRSYFWYIVSQDIELNFNTPMINLNTGQEVFNVKIEELNECGIVQYIPTGNISVDQKAQQTYEEALKENKDKLSKYTLSTALNQLFDVTEMPNNSDFSLYNHVLINIRNAKQNNQGIIYLTKSELDKLKKLFEKPPKNPQLNRIVGFVHECLEKAYVHAMITLEESVTNS